ncbi:MAG: hypothetical protein NT099_03125 [Candidatus Saganbacteria bacterium]|nr:hypothetical protein [Candidatus Saganbacteria bacterium]
MSAVDLPLLIRTITGANGARGVAHASPYVLTSQVRALLRPLERALPPREFVAGWLQGQLWVKAADTEVLWPAVEQWGKFIGLVRSIKDPKQQLSLICKHPQEALFILLLLANTPQEDQPALIEFFAKRAYLNFSKWGKKKAEIQQIAASLQRPGGVSRAEQESIAKKMRGLQKPQMILAERWFDHLGVVKDFFEKTIPGNVLAAFNHPSFLWVSRLPLRWQSEEDVDPRFGKWVFIVPSAREAVRIAGELLPAFEAGDLNVMKMELSPHGTNFIRVLFYEEYPNEKTRDLAGSVIPGAVPFWVSDRDCIEAEALQRVLVQYAGAAVVANQATILHPARLAAWEQEPVEADTVSALERPEVLTARGVTDLQIAILRAGLGLNGQVEPASRVGHLLEGYFTSEDELAGESAPFKARNLFRLALPFLIKDPVARGRLAQAKLQVADSIS